MHVLCDISWRLIRYSAVFNSMNFGLRETVCLIAINRNDLTGDFSLGFGSSQFPYVIDHEIPEMVASKCGNMWNLKISYNPILEKSCSPLLMAISRSSQFEPKPELAGNQAIWRTNFLGNKFLYCDYHLLVVFLRLLLLSCLGVPPALTP